MLREFAGSVRSGIIGMLAMHALMLTLNLDLDVIIVVFGLFVAAILNLIIGHHAANQREFDSIVLIGESGH